jgi:flagellar protein FlbD
MKPYKWRAFFRPTVQHQEPNMIQLTRLNNHPLVVNSDLIKFVEQAPDTVITLVSGEKIVVRESAQNVLERVVQFRRSVLQGIALWSDSAAALPPVLESIAEGNGPAGEE